MMLQRTRQPHFSAIQYGRCYSKRASSMLAVWAPGCLQGQQQQQHSRPRRAFADLEVINAVSGALAGMA